MQAIQISKAFGARDVLTDVSFRIDPGDRLAVVGRNGEGKTTLLRILAGRLASDGGQVSLPRGATVALHDQRPPLGSELTLGEYVAEGMHAAQDAERELAELESRMAGGDAGPAVMAAYEAAQARLASGSLVSAGRLDAERVWERPAASGSGERSGLSKGACLGDGTFPVAR